MEAGAGAAGGSGGETRPRSTSVVSASRRQGVTHAQQDAVAVAAAALPNLVLYECGYCMQKVQMKLLRPEKVACSHCGSRMLYKTRPQSQLRQVSTD